MKPLLLTLGLVGFAFMGGRSGDSASTSAAAASEDVKSDDTTSDKVTDGEAVLAASATGDGLDETLPDPSAEEAEMVDMF